MAIPAQVRMLLLLGVFCVPIDWARSAVVLNPLGEYLARHSYGGAQLVRASNFFRAPVNSNGTPGDLLVDTGAPASVIFRGSLHRLGLRETPTDKTVSGAFGSSNEHYGLTTIGSLTMGNCRLLHVPVAVISDREGNGIFRRFARTDGLFALGEMLKFGAVLDLGNRLLFVRPAGRNGDIGAGVKRLLTDEGYIATQMLLTPKSQLLVPATINDLRTHLIVDTGAFVTVIDREAALQAKIGGTRTRIVPQGIGKSGGEVSVARFPSLQIGRYELLHASAAITHLSPALLNRGTDEEAAGLLGIDYLATNSAVFDFNSGTLFLKPKPIR